jgi:hypothetical protein
MKNLSNLIITKVQKILAAGSHQLHEPLFGEKEKKIGIFPISDDTWLDVGQWSEFREAAEKIKKKLTLFK